MRYVKVQKMIICVTQEATEKYKESRRGQVLQFKSTCILMSLSRFICSQILASFWLDVCLSLIG